MAAYKMTQKRYQAIIALAAHGNYRSAHQIAERTLKYSTYSSERLYAALLRLGYRWHSKGQHWYTNELPF